MVKRWRWERLRDNKRTVGGEGTAKEAEGTGREKRVAVRGGRGQQ
jgi:hypothetical protein